jgi:hypothetical protein
MELPEANVDTAIVPPLSAERHGIDHCCAFRAGIAS